MAPCCERSFFIAVGLGCPVRGPSVVIWRPQFHDIGSASKIPLRCGREWPVNGPAFGQHPLRDRCSENPQNLVYEQIGGNYVWRPSCESFPVSGEGQAKTLRTPPGLLAPYLHEVLCVPYKKTAVRSTGRPDQTHVRPSSLGWAPRWLTSPAPAQPGVWLARALARRPDGFADP